MNIYISNLNTAVKSEEIVELFLSYGKVKSAEVVMDIFTGKSRGFAYVEMEDEEAAQNAITSLHKTEFSSQKISVEQAKPRTVHMGSYKVGNTSSINPDSFKKTKPF